MPSTLTPGALTAYYLDRKVNRIDLLRGAPARAETVMQKELGRGWLTLHQNRGLRPLPLDPWLCFDTVLATDSDRDETVRRGDNGPVAFRLPERMEHATIRS